MGFFDMGIREIVFLVLRLIAATGGFFVGYILTGPIMKLSVWAVLRRQLPGWSVTCGKILGGAGLALLIYLFLPLGMGGSGGGTGGGIGLGKGPFKGNPGDGTATATGKGPPTNPVGTATGTEKGRSDSEVLVIEMLGPQTAEGEKCYKLQRKSPPIGYDALEAFWNQSRAQWSRVEIVLTRTSTSENDPAVDRVRKLVQNSDDNKKRTLAIVDESAK